MTFRKGFSMNALYTRMLLYTDIKLEILVIILLSYNFPSQVIVVLVVNQ